MNAIFQLVLSYAQSHQEFIYGAAFGFAATHPRVIVRFLFNLLLKVPGVEPFIKANGPALRAWIKEGSAELVEDIDKADGQDEKDEPK